MRKKARAESAECYWIFGNQAWILRTALSFSVEAFQREIVAHTFRAHGVALGVMDALGEGLGLGLWV